MKTELTPLTIRLNEQCISILKQEARRVSYEKQSDVTHVDLIRDAVQKYITEIDCTKDHNIPSIIIDP